MAAYRRVYDSRHLQAGCQEPGSAPEPYARQSSMGYLYYSCCRRHYGYAYSVERRGPRLYASRAVREQIPMHTSTRKPIHSSAGRPHVAWPRLIAAAAAAASTRRIRKLPTVFGRRAVSLQNNPHTGASTPYKRWSKCTMKK